METVTIQIDGEKYEVEKGIPLVLAAERVGVRIPHLCFYEGTSVFAGCRLCVVQIDGVRGFPPSCNTVTVESQVIWTKTPEVLEMQRGVMSLILADHPDRCLSCHRQEHCGIDGICLRDAVVTYRCLTCAKNKRCEFQSVSEEMEMHKYPMTYYQEDTSWYGPQHVESPVRRDNPFIELDFNECILCARCVRTCDEVRGLGCYEMSFKGPQARIDTAFGLPLQDVGCDACGACVDACPVASILDKPSKWKGSAQSIVTTTCPNCGDGCQLDVEIKQDKILRVSPNKLAEPNHGFGCAHGRSGLGYVHSPGRLTTPLIKREGRFVQASWHEALSLIAERLAVYKGDAFAAIASPTATNEENYLLQKFARAVMGTNNVDYYTRFGGVDATQGLMDAFGYPAMTGSLGDILDAKCVLVISSDTAVSHPIAAWRARNAARYRGGSLIVANPRHNEMVKWAGQWLRYRPGTEVALLGGIMSAILDEGLADQEFIAGRVDDLAALQQSLAELSVDRAAEMTGVSADDIRATARTFAGSESGVILYDQSIFEYTRNRDAVRAIADLALLTGKLGKPNCGVMALRGDSNLQGALDMGCLPNYFPGYQPASGNPGLDFSQMVTAAASGRVRAAVIIGVDPLADDPQRSAITAALAKLEFSVALGSFLTPTAQEADVVLPLATFAEQEGTFTNTERRVQRVRHLFDAPGEARPGWQVLCELAQRMGASGFGFSEAAQVMGEISSTIPALYGGISHQRLEDGGVQWPCPSADHPGTPVLYTNGFPRGKASLQPIVHRPLDGARGGQFPLLLAAGRDLAPFHKEILISREDASACPYEAELLKVHPDDSLRYDVGDGETVRIVTPKGDFRVKAHVTDDVPPGALFLSLPVLDDPTPVRTGIIGELLELLPDMAVTPARLEKAQE